MAINRLNTLLNHYIEANDLQDLEGSRRTAIPGVHVYRAGKGSARQPLLYQSGIIVITQGYKVIYLGDQQVRYGAGDYLVLGVPLPLECEAFSEQGKPILGLAIDVSPQELHQMVSQLQRLEPKFSRPSCEPGCGLKSVSLSPAMTDTCVRLLESLVAPDMAEILGPGLMTELLYRVLTGPQKQTLYGLAQHDGYYARIAQTLQRIHQDYAQLISVESLARDANLSVSAFHKAFRQVTLESPMQYLKKVRLHKARELIQFQGRRANEAAGMVGYSSASQFSREYKRQFNQTPAALAKQAQSA